MLASPSLRLPNWIWELADFATVGLELGLVALIFFPRLIRLAVVLLVPFHLGVLVTMGIDFSGYLYLYLPILAHPFAGRVFGRWWDRRGKLAPLIVIAFVAAYRLAVVNLLPLTGAGDGSRAYLPALILFSVALVVLLRFVHAPRSAESLRPVDRPFHELANS